MPRFLVVGAGGIGGVVAAHLNEQGHDTTTLSTNPLIADAVNAHGFRVRGEASPGAVKGKVVERLRKSDGKFDYVLLATQPPQVEAAATSVLDWLADTGAMVCFQNGLCEERIAAIAGQRNVIGAVVAWGASMVEPGIYDRTSAGGFQIGRIDGGEDERLRELARVLECIGPTNITRNLLGARWSKLAINCAISSLGTVGGDRLGVLMRQRHVRRLTLEIMTEVTETARAHGIRLEKVAGTIDLEWIALTDVERASAGSPILMAKHALLLAVGARYRRLRSSMLAAIERGRPPSVEFLNGEVIARAKEKGLRTPINSAIRDEVLRIAQGKAKSSHQLLRAFYDSTRSLVAPGAKDAPEAARGESKAPPTTVEAAPLPQALDSTIDSTGGDADLQTLALQAEEQARADAAQATADAAKAELATEGAAQAEPARADAVQAPAGARPTVPATDVRVDAPAPPSQADLPVLASPRPSASPAQPAPVAVPAAAAVEPLEREKAETVPSGPPSNMGMSTKKGLPRLDSTPPDSGSGAPAGQVAAAVAPPAVVPPAGPTGTMSLKAMSVAGDDAPPTAAPSSAVHSSAVQTERDVRPPVDEAETIIEPEKLPPEP